MLIIKIIHKVYDKSFNIMNKSLLFIVAAFYFGFIVKKKNLKKITEPMEGNTFKKSGAFFPKKDLFLKLVLAQWSIA